MHEPLTPGLLVSLPSLDDPYFGRSVILLCEYDRETAFGLMINRPSMVKIKDLFEEELEHGSDVPLLVGGPVQPDFFWAIHSSDFSGENTTKLNEQVSLSSLAEVLEAIQDGQGPRFFHFGCGYSGWSPGQLDEELKEGAWWLAPMDNDLVLDSPYVSRWDEVLRNLGFHPDLTNSPTAGEA